MNIKAVKPVAVKVGKKTYYRVRLPITWTGGKTINRSFTTLALAEAYAEKEAILRENHGNKAYQITPGEREDAAKALDLLRTGTAHLVKKKIPTLKELAEDWLKIHAPKGERTAAEVFQEFVIDRSNKSPRHIKGIKREVILYSEQWGNKPFHKITSVDIRSYLTTPRWSKAKQKERKKSKIRPKWSNRTKQNTLITMAAIWQFGIKNGYCGMNIVREIDAKEDFKVVKESPQIATPSELVRYLETARQHRPGLVLLGAITAFAGIRNSEVMCLRWEDIEVNSNTILVRGTVAKTGKWRRIPMPQCLDSWLNLYRKTTGPIVEIRESQASDYRSDVLKKTGLQHWKPNILRHSAASYSMGLGIADPGRIGHEMGHSLKVMLRDYFNSTATPKSAKDYFSITPSSATS